MSAKPGKSLDDFRAAHDKSFIIPKQINEALGTLGESWEYESEFMKRAGLSATDMGVYRDQFTDYWFGVPSVGGKTPRRIWTGSKVFAKKLKEQLR